MTVLHYILTLLIHFTKSQFPDHIDLQQIEEVSYQDEKYNILKPTVHKITDYFEEFMLRSESRKDEKIFIDNDGFRHSWSGIGIKPKSLRKTDLTLYEINKNRQASSTSDEDVDDAKSSSEEGIKIPIPILRQEFATAMQNKKSDYIKSKQHELITVSAQRTYRTEHLEMNLLLSVLFLLGVVLVNVEAKPQVPYDYIPIGRRASVAELSGHPSDVVLNYERLFPARRKWIDHNYKFRRSNSEEMDDK